MKYKLNEHQQLRPHGGHHFTAHGILMKGDTLDEVVRQIKDYRINNAIPVGDPTDEVLQYYAAKWPFMVYPDEDAKEFRPSVMKERWMKWVRVRWLKPSVKQITLKEAEARWKVCQFCPYNKPLTPVNDEQTAIARKAFMLRRGQTIPSNIGFCALHGADIGAMVFLEAPVEVSDKPKDAANHTNCWVA